MDDLISRQAAIDAVVNITVFDNSKSIKDTCKKFFLNDNGWLGGIKDSIEAIEALPHAQQNRIARETAGKSPEEIYDFLHWLLIDYGRQFTDSRLAVIEWLKGESDEH